MRFTLSHPLVQAYRDRKVCVVNSFRSELSHKKAMFALLTDESLTALAARARVQRTPAQEAKLRLASLGEFGPAPTRAAEPWRASRSG